MRLKFIRFLKESKIRVLLVSIFGILMVLAICTILIIVSGAEPLSAYIALYTGFLGNVQSISETFVKTSPILIIALGIIVAFRCGVLNIGAEGQLYVGALITAWIAITISELPAVFLGITELEDKRPQFCKVLEISLFSLRRVDYPCRRNFLTVEESPNCPTRAPVSFGWT